MRDNVEQGNSERTLSNAVWPIYDSLVDQSIAYQSLIELVVPGTKVKDQLLLEPSAVFHGKSFKHFVSSPSPWNLDLTNTGVESRLQKSNSILSVFVCSVNSFP